MSRSDTAVCPTEAQRPVGRAAASRAPAERCTRCVLTAGVPGIFFDDHGECNYCALHDRLAAQWPLGAAGRRQLDVVVERIRRCGRRGKYDCIIGVSGGTDSTYLLWLARELGLRPLAVHFDNGWNSEIAVHNIQRALKTLDIDLFTYVVDWEEFKDLLVAYLRASLPWADGPTDLGITGALYHVAAREGIRHIIVGNHFRSEGKMPTEWTYIDGRTMAAIHRRFGRRPMRSFPNLTLTRLCRYSLLQGITMVRPLNHIEYDKPQAQALLSRELGWEDYGGHHYESLYTRFVYAYLLPHKFQIDKRIVTCSAQVRSGTLAREQALRALAEPPGDPQRLQADLDYVIKKLELSSADFNAILALPPRRFSDYPSYYPLFRRNRRIMKHLARLILPWTPPFLHEMDFRDRPGSERRA